MAPAEDAAADFPAGWCDVKLGTATRTTGECMRAAAWASRSGVLREVDGRGAVGRGAAAAATWIFPTDAAAPRLRRG